MLFGVVLFASGCVLAYGVIWFHDRTSKRTANIAFLVMLCIYGIILWATPGLSEGEERSPWTMLGLLGVGVGLALSYVVERYTSRSNR